MSLSPSSFDGVYIDFMGYIPLLTHFFAPERLNNRFSFLLEPNTYCKAYASDVTQFNDGSENVEPKQKALLIHNLGLLKRLSDHNVNQQHFWHNLCNQEDCQTHLIQMSDSNVYVYLPFTLKPTLNITLDPARLRTSKPIKYCDISTEVRVFPQGAAVVHVRLYIKSPLLVEDLVNLQNALLKEPIFNMSQAKATELGLKSGQGISLQQLFFSIGQCIWKTLYLGKPDTIDKTTLITKHRILNPMGDAILTDADITALMGPSKNPRVGEIEDMKQGKVEKVLEPGTVLAFYHGATLLYASKTESNVSCFRNNYSNVVEFGLMHGFFLTAIEDAMDKDVIKKGDF